MSTKVIGIIPARYGSTRFPGKLLVSILGKTLLQHTFENAKRISSIDELIIATDDEKIFAHVKNFGGTPVLTSSTHINGTERLAEVLTKHPEYLRANIIVNFQGDEPFVDPKGVEKAIQLLLQDTSASMATLATPLKDKKEACHPSIVKCIIDQQQNALYFSRSLIPGNKKNKFNPNFTYYRHIGLYVYRPSFLIDYQKLPATPLQKEEDLEQLKVLEHGYRIKVALTDQPCIGVDEPEDINKIEQWICKQNTFL
jgi:3-deoxy-manno-octulosonate cytidylyltransferase (CMP-KDO synthetase)